MRGVTQGGKVSVTGKHYSWPPVLPGVLLAIALGLASFQAALAATDSSATDPVGPPGSASDDAITKPAAVIPFKLDSKPRWEAGIGGGYISAYDYPGSLDKNKVGLVLPYFIYRSENFRFGGRGVSAVAVEQPRVKLDLSLGGSLNAESEGNRARAGMPDLDVLFEIGPGLKVRLAEYQWARAGRSTLTWDTKLRLVFATDFKSANTQGVVFASGLRYRQKNVFGLPVDLLGNIEFTFANERLHDYLYEVPPQYANADRPEYDARGGFLETSVFVGAAIRPTENIRLFTGLVSGHYANAANRDSPLFETNSSTGFAIGLVWRLAQSKNNIQVYETE